MKNFAIVAFMAFQIMTLSVSTKVFASNRPDNKTKLGSKISISGTLETRIFYKTGLVKLAFNSPRSQKVILRILDKSGTVLLDRKVIRNQVSAIQCYDISQLPKGIYLIETLAADEKNVDTFEVL